MTLKSLTALVIAVLSGMFWWMQHRLDRISERVDRNQEAIIANTARNAAQEEELAFAQERVGKVVQWLITRIPTDDE